MAPLGTANILKQPLVGHVGVLDTRGVPRAHAPHQPTGAPGLYLFGYRFSLPNLRWLRIDARRLAPAVARFLSDTGR